MVRIVFGPMIAEEFFEFLPNGDIARQAAGLIRWFLGPVIDFEMQPVVASGEVPVWCRLGESEFEGNRLGWSSWLTDEAFAVPATEAIFGESEYAGMEA